ncbi:MAG: n-acetylglutamate synthase [Flavobacteriaceae bacterium]|nr:n-acetylglutamate synthase [Flavobacteriaceae bacterium]
MYNNKVFKLIKTTNSGELDLSTNFHYIQSGNILSCTYKSNNILKGHLLGNVDPNGKIDMRYHQINKNGVIQTGSCISNPILMPNGKIQLHEKWKWTSGDCKFGESILEEV